MYKKLDCTIPEIEAITDWFGNKLDPEIRNQITVGNFVRVCVKYPDGSEVFYIKITEIHENEILGIVDDPYKYEHDFFEILLRNGDKVSFLREFILEIPLDWEGNENLEKIALFTEKDKLK